MGCCESSNEPLVPIKCGEFLDKLSNRYLLTKHCDPWRYLVILLFTYLIAQIGILLFLWLFSPQWARASSLLGFQNHTQTHHTR